MKISNCPDPGRRDFLTNLIPACASACLIPGNIFKYLKNDENIHFLQEKPDFNQQIKSRMTYRQYFNKRFKEYYIPMMKVLSDEIGKERLIELIKKKTYDLNFKLG